MWCCFFKIKYDGYKIILCKNEIGKNIKIVYDFVSWESVIVDFFYLIFF